MAHTRRPGRGAAFSTKPGNLDPPSGKSATPFQSERLCLAIIYRRAARFVRRRKPLRFMTEPAIQRRNPPREQYPRLHCFVTKIPLQRQRAEGNTGIVDAMSEPWNIMRLDGHLAASSTASASCDRETGTASSASPCTSSTGARFISSATRRSGATNAPENARMAAARPLGAARRTARSSPPG